MRGWAALLLLVARSAAATTFVVAESGGDFTAIQAALDAAMAGDTVHVREKATPYFEKLVFPRSGAAGAWITLDAWPGDQPVLDGTGVAGDHLILIESRSWVRIVGLELRNNLGLNDGSGIRVVGSGSHVELRHNRIHDIRGAQRDGHHGLRHGADRDLRPGDRRQRDLRLRAGAERGAHPERQRRRLRR